MYERILTVCTGNICRSPLADAMLRLQLAADGRGDIARVRSAGIATVPDKRVDDTVLYVAKGQPRLLELLEQHRSQVLNPSLTWWADLILVMESRHARHIEKLDPSAKHKVHLLGQWTHKSIPDPYLKHETEYREAHARIAQAVVAWRDHINT